MRPELVLDGGRRASRGRVIGVSTLRDRIRSGLRLTAILDRPSAVPVARDIYLDFAWVGVLNAVVGTFAPVFALRLGATPLLVGALTAGSALVAIVVSLPAGSLFAPRSPAWIFWMRLASRLPFLALAALPWLSLEHPAEILVALVVLSYVPGHVSSVWLTSVFAELVPPRHRAEVAGTRLLMLGLVGSVTLLLGGVLLERLPFPTGYQVLFLVGFLTSLAGLRVFRRVLAARAAHVASAPEASGTVGPAEGRRSAERFVRFAASSFVFQLGLGMGGPLISIYWVRDLGLGDARVGLLATAAGLASVVAYPLWGRLAGRRGEVLALGLALFGHALYPILTASTRDADVLLLVVVAGGAASAGTTLGLFSGLLRVAPKEDRLRAIALYNTVTYLALLIGPLLGSFAAERLGIVAALLLAGGVRLLGATSYVLPRLRGL